MKVKSLMSLMLAGSMSINSASAAEPATCIEDAVRKLHSEWILAWDKHPGDPPFEMRRNFARFYAWDAANVVLYDTFEPGHRVAHSADEYGSFWSAPFTALRSAKHRVLDGPDVVANDGIAASTMEFAARLEAQDRSIVGIRARSSIVWICTPDGWRIIREHNSTRIVSRDEIDRLLDISPTKR